MTLVLALALFGMSSPSGVVEYTSTREVTSILGTTDGSVVIGTRGGRLVRSKAGEWSKQTFLSGLDSNDQPTSPLAAFDWRGKSVSFSPLEIRVGSRSLPLPSSAGTHVSAATIHGDFLYAAVFGGGLYRHDGKNWASVDAPSQDITVLSNVQGTLWLGTRRAGALVLESEGWKSVMPAGEIPNHNIQSLAFRKGALYACTLEDGLAVLENGVWRQVRSASNAPRQVIAFKGSLFVRHGTGAVEKFSNEGWTTGLEKQLPRKEATAISADSETLFVGQWGGWSEFDGSGWKHRFDVPPLKGIQVTAVLATPEFIWVGTQGSGLVRVDRSSGAARLFDERHGLKDDWVTRLAAHGRGVLAGTFAGGIALIQGEKVTTGGPTAVRDISGRFFVSESQVWEATEDGFIKRELPLPLNEIQAITVTAEGMWIGCRTGLYRVALKG